MTGFSRIKKRSKEWFDVYFKKVLIFEIQKSRSNFMTFLTIHFN